MPRERGVARRHGRVASGHVDAGSTGELEKVHARGLSILDGLKSHYPDGRPDRIIAATGDILEKQPEMIKAYLKATIRAYWFIRTMPENLPYVSALERKLSVESPNPEEQQWWRKPDQTAEKYEGMPFPVDGLPTGFEQYFQEQVEIGEIRDFGDYEKILYLDPIREAHWELEERGELQADVQRMKAVAEKYGY